MVHPGGHIDPIFVPPTPSGELANSLKMIADEEAKLGVHFKIIETGGLSMRAILQKSNPLQNIGRDEADCLLGCVKNQFFVKSIFPSCLSV